MPFDGTENTTRLNRARLIEALRAPMPAGFEWDFNQTHRRTSCGSVGCALGLAVEIGISRDASTISVALNIGISRKDAEAIFIPVPDFETGILEEYGRRMYSEITPAMVADKLEALP